MSWVPSRVEMVAIDDKREMLYSLRGFPLALTHGLEVRFKWVDDGKNIIDVSGIEVVEHGIVVRDGIMVRDAS